MKERRLKIIITILVLLFATSAIVYTTFNTTNNTINNTTNSIECQYSSQVTYDGNGTSRYPYEIQNGTQLQCISHNLTAHYELKQNISTSDEHIPVGRSGEEFSGQLDGNGHEIRNLRVESVVSETGMFGYVGDNGVVKNLSLVDARITVPDGRNVQAISTVVGINKGTVERITATGSVDTSAYDVGGIVGRNHGTVRNSSADIRVKGSLDVGGLVGLNENVVINSYATGDVDGNDRVGGLVGTNRNGTIEDSYAVGDVNGDSVIGGLAGKNENATIVRSYATGDVRNGNTAGGLVGSNLGTISKTYATGTVDANIYVGGLVGTNDGTLEESYSIGNVSGNGENVGGLVGSQIGGTVTDSYWNSNTINVSDAGTQVSRSDILNANLEGFSDVWITEEYLTLQTVQ